MRNCTSGPLPLARGGLGWGSSWAIATSPTHKEAIAPVWSRVPTSFFVTGISPRQEDPTLTLPLARGGDRRTPP
ncbi:hypothetical protein NG791_18260 [Laspinema sp. D1]|uniref:hypothetical protein n=1 Tax=Laspinema palackyanum TaxID=3231601 RepID=UPI00347F3761|nr:hypothetical protein [Laspinema sp. D2b]